MDYHYPYPRPAVTVDLLLISRDQPRKVLLIQRLRDPYRDQWALPGGFVDENEDLEAAAYRELMEETGIRDVTLRQFRTYGTPFRDPRGHTVSVVFWAETGLIVPHAADDAKEAQWFPIEELPPLAFDHYQIVTDFLSFFDARKSVE
jgi:8-oxo-dGTP diphosphatase